MADPTHIVRTGGTDWSKVWRGRHPFNATSEMQLVPLGGPTGMKRVGASLIRIPPGKESFIPHAHTLSEEFAFVLEGRGEVVLDGEAHPIGPGDFVGFPTDGVVHSVRSVGPGDLVYLTAGEHTAGIEVADMPSIGKTTVFRNGRMELYDTASAEVLTTEQWMARTRIEE
ncbi:MAG: cupin domain-containing protein [Phenylobacterium sp.]